jgi:hypothetical protein
MNAPRHLYLDTAGKKLVPENHPDAAELIAAEGQPINTKRLHAAGLTLEDVTAHVEADGPEEKPIDAAPARTVQKDRQR